MSHIVQCLGSSKLIELCQNETFTQKSIIFFIFYTKFSLVNISNGRKIVEASYEEDEIRYFDTKNLVDVF